MNAGMNEVINWSALRFVQLPPLLASLATAEAFFKFHSFTLEAVAFLSLWYVLRRLYTPLETRFRRQLHM